MICAECFYYEAGLCWSRRSGKYGCRMQPEGSCDCASKTEYTDGGIPPQSQKKEKEHEPL